MCYLFVSLFHGLLFFIIAVRAMLPFLANKDEYTSTTKKRFSSANAHQKAVFEIHSLQQMTILQFSKKKFVA